MGWRTLRAALLLGLLALTPGCAHGGGQSASPSPHASPRGVVYENPALGVSFRHPAGWRSVRTVSPDTAPGGVGDVEMHSPGGVVFDVSTTEKRVPKAPFDAKGQLATDRDSAKIFGFHILTQDVVSVAGEPFARTDMLVKGRHVATLTGLASGMLVGVNFHCPLGIWPAQSKILDAVLSTMSFTAPVQSTSGGS